MASSSIHAASLASGFMSDSSATPPPSPLKSARARTHSSPGVAPADLVGKTLTQLRCSPHHPVISLHLSDNDTFQIRVDGYNPQNPGLPKHLEMDPLLIPLTIENRQPVPLTILGCASVTLTDKAFQKRKLTSIGEAETNIEWDQRHSAIALKFATTSGSAPRWHCIWATREEYDIHSGECIFRSYEDVYVDRLDKRRPTHRKKQSLFGRPEMHL